MQIALVIVLLVVIIMGIHGATSDYASIQQSQAAIEQARAVSEVAKVAQTNAAANLVVIMTTSLVILLIVAVIAVALLYAWKRSRTQLAVPAARQVISQNGETPALPTRSLEMMLMMEMIQTLRSQRGERQTPRLEEPKSDETMDHPLDWLR